MGGLHGLQVPKSPTIQLSVLIWGICVPSKYDLVQTVSWSWFYRWLSFNRTRVSTSWPHTIPRWSFWSISVGWDVHIGQKSSHFWDSSNQCWIVSPPRILIQTNFWYARSREKRYTRCVGNFVGPLGTLECLPQTHFGNFFDFVGAKFHEFYFNSLNTQPKSSFSAQKVYYATCIGRIWTALVLDWT